MTDPASTDGRSAPAHPDDEAPATADGVWDGVRRAGGRWSVGGAPVPVDGDGHGDGRALREVPRPTFDHDRITAGVRLLLEGIGVDPEDPRVVGTPQRVARMYDEIFAGLRTDPDTVIDAMFDAGHDELVMVRDISLASVCEHHLVPFTGSAHVGYIPNSRGEVTGLSKLARLVDAVARRPTMQERLTSTVADVLERTLHPRGVIVVVEAEHLCMTMRGVRKPGSTTVTSAVRGIIRDNPATRAEAMALAMGSRPRTG